MNNPWSQTLVSFFIWFSFTSWAPAQSISLKKEGPGKPDPNVKTILIKVDPGAYSGNEPASLGCGIPLREKQVGKLDDLSIVDEKNKPIPAEFEARTTWDDGGVQWLWTDFRGKPDIKYYLRIGGNQKCAKGGLTVQTKGDEITINNGIQEWVWNRTFATPVRLNTIAGGALKPVFQVAKGDGVYLINQKDQRAALAGKESELDWKIETSNSVRAVLRVEGWYVTEKGEKMARAVVRYNVYWNDPTMRMDHRFIVTHDNDEVWYKELGIRFPLAEKVSAEAMLAKKEGVYTTKLGAGDEVFISQKNYPIYNRLKEYSCLIAEMRAKEAVKEVEDCKEAGGWAAVSNGESTMAMALKDFAQQFPKEYSATTRGLTVKLWSGRDGKILDYKPQTMANDWWKDWLTRLTAAFERNNVEASRSMYEREGFTVEKITSGDFNPSCVGASKFHELYIRYDADKTTESQIGNWARAAVLPPLSYTDPQWITRVDARVLPTLSYHGEGGEKYAALERYISVWFDKYMEPLEFFPYTGWFDWGKTASGGGFEKLPDGTIFSLFQRSGAVNFYGWSKHTLYAWLRSGDRKYLEAVQRKSRMMTTHRVIQWSGGKDKRKKGYLAGNMHYPYYWGGTGGVSGVSFMDYEGGACLEYYLRDARFLRDDMELRAEALERDYTPGWNTDGADEPVRNMYAWVELYRLTKKPILKKFAEQIFNTCTDLNQECGINTNYYKSPQGVQGPYYKLNRKIMWLTFYADWTQGEKEKKTAIKALLEGGVTQRKYPDSSAPGGFKSYSYYHFDGPDGYKNYLGYVAARTYDWTGDAGMFEHIDWQLDGLTKTWEAYEALPEKERSLEGAKSRIGGYAYKFLFPKIIIPHKTTVPFATLTFNYDKNMVAFLAVPAGIWAKCGASYDYPTINPGE